MRVSCAPTATARGSASETHLNTIVAAVDIITKEEVPCVGWVATDLEELHQVELDQGRGVGGRVSAVAFTTAGCTPPNINSHIARECLRRLEAAAEENSMSQLTSLVRHAQKERTSDGCIDFKQVRLLMQDLASPGRRERHDKRVTRST